MLVYHMVLSFMDNNDCYSSVFFLSWIIMVGIATGFVCLGQELSVYHTLSWTILGDIFHGCVCHVQYRLVYQPVLSVMDKIG